MPARRLTPQKLHSIIQARIKQLSSKYSPSQRINRQTYDVYNGFKGFFGVMCADSETLVRIRDACREAGLSLDDSEMSKGFIKVLRTY